jgi:hypothetical protein
MNLVRLWDHVQWVELDLTWPFRPCIFSVTSETMKTAHCETRNSTLFIIVIKPNISLCSWKLKFPCQVHTEHLKYHSDEHIFSQHITENRNISNFPLVYSVHLAANVLLGVGMLHGWTVVFLGRRVEYRCWQLVVQAPFRQTVGSLLRIHWPNKFGIFKVQRSRLLLFVMRLCMSFTNNKTT